MFYGVSMSPAGWLGTFFLALITIMAPLLAIEYVGSLLPSFLETPFIILGAFILFPLLLCYLYSKKIFATGRSSVLFTFYTWMYVVIGFQQCFKAFYGFGGFSFFGLIGGFLIIGLGVAMHVWSRKEREKFSVALADQEANDDAIAREEQVKIHAEAILRAEEMKKDKAV